MNIAAVYLRLSTTSSVFGMQRRDPLFADWYRASSHSFSRGGGTSPCRRMTAPPPIASGAPRRCAIRCVSPLPPRLPICLAPTQQRASGVTPFRQPVLHFTEAGQLTPLPEILLAGAPIGKGQDRRRVMQPNRLLHGIQYSPTFSASTKSLAFSDNPRAYLEQTVIVISGHFHAIKHAGDT